MHVPFCFTRCGYCDFNTYTPAEWAASTPTAGCRCCGAELELAAAGRGGPTVQTVFVGGGTPSLLGGERLAAVLDSVRGNFELAADAEVTTEANPESTWPDCFAAARAGLPGCRWACSRWRRTCSAFWTGCTRRAARRPRPREARAEGFEHVSLDLIYGTPGESDDDLLWSVDAAIETGVDHVSAYALVVEDGTALARRVRRGELAAPDDDVLARRYELLDDAAVAGRLRLVRGVELEPARRGVPAQSRLLGRRPVVGCRAGRAQLRRRRRAGGTSSTPTPMPSCSARDVAGRRLRATGRRDPSHRGRAAEDPAASGSARRPA